MDRRLLSLEQAAEVLGTNKAQIYALVRRGDLPALKIGGRGVWRVDSIDLDAYINQAKADTAQWVKDNPFERAEEDDLSDDED